MTNPYRGKPAYQFWRASVAEPDPFEVDPVVNPGVLIGPEDRIATAGSCFAQHIARTLSASGYGYMVVEDTPAFDFSENENYGVFSARYGNIYTPRQLLQLMRRAYSIFEPAEEAWLRADGCYIDPFRPRIQAGGFETVEQLQADREAHFSAVRSLLEDCDVFVFTLGLTESWVSTHDGAVYPLAPGVVATDVDPASYRFHNFTVDEMTTDLARFLDMFEGINPGVRIILTVSPVPLIATFEPRHVLAATGYSKAALRVTAQQIASTYENVEYFPSYEMITGPHAQGRFFADDLREIRPEGVAYVMSSFVRNYLAGEGVARPRPKAAPTSREAINTEMEAMQLIGDIICDEDAIVAGL